MYPFEGKINLDKDKKINSFKNKKILYIDDKADQYWSEILKRIFVKDAKNTNNTDFFIIPKKAGQNIEDYKKKILKKVKSNDWDLILLDLRLDEKEEGQNNSPEEYSGAILLEEIKRINRGFQVIMFTASNKAWNMKVLLEKGADGYYIKESPLADFDEKQSKLNYKNFKEDIKDCFNKKFLYGFAENHEEINGILNTILSSGISGNKKRFLEKTKQSLKIVFELLQKGNSSKYRNFAFLTYYQVLEDYIPLIWKHLKNNNGKIIDAYVDYVSPTNKGIQVIGNGEWNLKKPKEMPYFVIGKELDPEKAYTLAKISFILVFKFHKNNDSLKEWGELNHLRNTIAVHGGKTFNSQKIEIMDLEKMLEIVKMFVNSLK